ncbi:unnamed protein product [Macrosiphum euphorbiae]|uniref:Transmembrane protein n=2 Tax=Macrosiphum euphorbiae TaxID=13131 RepID=A0AAV0XDC6_9HEMI|nr:unnamed protein product [Macrosiphum euphorbiae]
MAKVNPPTTVSQRPTGISLSEVELRFPSFVCHLSVFLSIVPRAVRNQTVIMVAQKIWALMLAGLLVASSANAGPIAAGICYAGCAAVTVACFGAAGFTFGTVPGAVIAATPALAACNAAFGICEASCVAALIVPTP